MTISNFQKFAASIQDYRKLERENENLVRDHQRRVNRLVNDKNVRDYFTYNQNIKPSDPWYSRMFNTYIYNPFARAKLYAKAHWGNPIYDAWTGKAPWGNVLRSAMADSLTQGDWNMDEAIIQNNLENHPELAYGSTRIVNEGNPNEGYTYNPETNTVDKKSEYELAKLVPESSKQLRKDINSTKLDYFATLASAISAGQTLSVTAATAAARGALYAGKELIKKPFVSAITHPKSTLAGTALLSAPIIETRNTYDNTLISNLSSVNPNFNWDKLVKNSTPDQLNRATDFIHKNLVTPNPRYDPKNPGTQKKFNLKPLQTSQLHEMSKDLMSIFNNK